MSQTNSKAEPGFHEFRWKNRTKENENSVEPSEAVDEFLGNTQRRALTKPVTSQSPGFLLSLFAKENVKHHSLTQTFAAIDCCVTLYFLAFWRWNLSHLLFASLSQENSGNTKLANPAIFPKLGREVVLETFQRAPMRVRDLHLHLEIRSYVKNGEESSNWTLALEAAFELSLRFP